MILKTRSNLNFRARLRPAERHRVMLSTRHNNRTPFAPARLQPICTAVHSALATRRRLFSAFRQGLPLNTVQSDVARQSPGTSGNRSSAPTSRFLRAKRPAHSVDQHPPRWPNAPNHRLPGRPKPSRPVLPLRLNLERSATRQTVAASDDFVDIDVTPLRSVRRQHQREPPAIPPPPLTP